MKHNRLNRMLALLLACILLAGCSPAAVSAPETPQAQPEAAASEEPAPSQEAEEGGLPAIGDTLSGFTVTQIVPMDALSATGVLFTHEKSGATLLYLSTDDTNRSFDISFRTPALDDKGKPHVFEHITISGSQKYPDANMFFPFIYQTYSTFVNAMTYHGMTTFPVASLSEEQLMTMMDYYLSGVFMPLLYDEPKLAQREAWRYELTSPDADMNIAGTVYSEMQGHLTPSMQARDNNFTALFEGSTTAYESGGVPENIRTLSYEELIEFHDAYYHPSNALITLYGDLDLARFLAFIDGEYLSKYDKKDVDVDMGEIAPYTETKYAEYEAPVEKDAVTKDATDIYYSFALNGADLYDSLAMSVLTSVLQQESSPIMQALRAKLPQAQISIGSDFDSPSAPYLSFSATGVNPEDRDVFVAAVDEGLKAISEEGISSDALDSVLALNKLSILTTAENTDLGVNASVIIALGWTYFNSVEYFPTYQRVIDEMTKDSAEALIDKYITQNLHRAVSVTKPVAGLAEENAQALAKELAEKKAAMTPEEIDALVASSAEFVEWGNTPASDEVLSGLLNVEVKDLPEELRHYDVVDETKDGVRYLSSAVEVSDVFSGTIQLGNGTIPVENLQDVQVLLLLLGELDTASHSKEELSTLITRYLSGLSTSLSAAQGYNGAEGYYAANISWMGLGEDAEASTALLKELLFETDFSDTETIQSLLTRWSSGFATGLDSNALNVQLGRSAAMFNDYNAYTEHVSNYALYAKELELIELAESDPAALTQRLEMARNILLNRFGATVLLAGGQNAIAAYQAGIENILSSMDNEERAKVDYSVLRLPKRNEGIINNSTVHMNIMFSDYAGYTGKDVIANALLDDTFMLPKLRNALGAYGAYTALRNNLAYLYTYRDPNLAGTFEIFNTLPEYIRSEELTQETVDGYIIGGYTSLSRPQGLLSGAITAMVNMLTGCTEELRLQWMQEAKAITPEDFAAVADAWEAALHNGVRSSSGTESALMEASDLFDVLIYPDGTEKALTALDAAA